MKKGISKSEAKNNFLPRKQVNILGVKVDSTSEVEVLTKIAHLLKSGTKFYIVTPNPEIILHASSDQEFKAILNRADFAVPDGVGLKLAVPNLSIIHGRHLVEALLVAAKKQKLKVFFLGGTPGGIARLNYPAAYGPILNQEGRPVSESNIKTESEVIDKINKIQPDFLFVGFGPPKQEKWINRNLPRLKIGCAMAVGGTIDYLAGVVPPPPQWVERLELEWLWRLFTQPQRLPRILRATVLFPLKVLLSKISP